MNDDTFEKTPERIQPTPEQTAIALEQSIEHWKRHATGTAGPFEGIHCSDCALCGLFMRGELERHDPTQCEGCPIKAATKQTLCNGTPWYLCYDMMTDHGGTHNVYFKGAAAKMVAFLESLRVPAEKVVAPVPPLS